MEQRFNLSFYLNDGEEDYIISENIGLYDILPDILNFIKEKYPDWKWDDGVNGWSDICRHNDGDTYIRINGIGDVWKGQTYFILTEVK